MAEIKKSPEQMENELDAIWNWQMETAWEINKQIQKAFPNMGDRVTVSGNSFGWKLSTLAENIDMLIVIRNSGCELTTSEAIEYASALTFAAGLIQEHLAGIPEAIKTGVPIEDIFV